MKENVARAVMAMNQSAWLMAGEMLRNFVDGDMARVFHTMAWLLTLRHMPNAEIGKRRRNGHVLSFGSTNSLESYNQLSKLTTLITCYQNEVIQPQDEQG